jgi:hypothetical protein
VAYAGATVSGTASMPEREAYFKQTLPIHRTYWGPSNVNSGITAAANDVKAKRLPWISFKLPANWTVMADGGQDAWVNSIVDRLDAINGPVWLAFHHEPENDGQSLTEWTRMQRHLGQLVKAHKSNNIAFSIIVMGWHQVYGAAKYHLENIWPGDGLVDIIGQDPYNWYWTPKPNGAMNTQMSDMQPYWTAFDNFAKAHGARWGVAEIGYNNEAAQKDATWITNAFTSMRASGGVGMSYFDTSFNDGGSSLTLDLASKKAAWAKAINMSARIC